MISVDNIRLTSISLDVGDSIPVWRAGGYYLTKDNKIFGGFNYSSHPNDSKMGFNHFVPNSAMEKLTSLMFEEAHDVLGDKIRRDFGDEQKEIITIKKAPEGDGNTTGEVEKIKEIL